MQKGDYGKGVTDTLNAKVCISTQEWQGAKMSGSKEHDRSSVCEEG